MLVTARAMERAEMSLKKGLPWIAAALVVSVAAMTLAVQQRRPDLAGGAAALYCLLTVWAGLRSNVRLWALAPTRITADAAPVAGVRNAALIALGYAWGACAMAALYTLGGLVWQHGLQYATGMAVIAFGVGLYARGLASTGSVLRSPAAQLVMFRATVLHAAAAAGGVAALFMMAKLKSSKGDWGANVVFLMGGVTLFALSVIAATTQWRLSRRG